jgi:iron(III) transport system substrate-binding protein
LRSFAAIILGWLISLSPDNGATRYPAAYSDTINAARQEKKLVIYSVIHADAAVGDLLAAFHRRYPFIEVTNSDDDGARTYQRFKREIAAGKPSADFIWSSAMDLQEKLINDGLSLPYETPEMPYIPAWAHWRDLGYGVTLEPIAFVYNSRYLSSVDMPRTHSGLREMLRRDARKLNGRVAVYNPDSSEVGMLLLSQDIRVTNDSWALFDVFGKTHAHLYNTSRDMLLNILSGDQWVGYDVIASYALEMQKTHPELVVVFPRDYTLVMSRVAFITASAKHPNTARLFLDFLLSEEGQLSLKSHGMGPVRTDIAMPEPQSHIDPVRTQAIRIGPGLLSDLDSLVRAQFLRRWRQRGADG